MYLFLKFTNSFSREKLSLFKKSLTLLNINTFQKNLTQLSEHWQSYHYLLGVSGGADSMALAYLFHASKLHFHIAHVNYGLRGTDSDEDEDLVKEFCVKHDIPFHLYKVTEEDQKPPNSIQEWARNLRYRFFRKVQEEQHLDHLVTAHHLNDQLETFIINLSKASGIKGLRGIPASENHILRPLLKFSKQEIYDFAEHHNIPYREDLSNQKSDYLRNKIRHQVVPELMQTNDQFLENFSRSIHYLHETYDFVREHIEKTIKNISHNQGAKVIFDRKQLASQSPLVQFEILRTYGFDRPTEINKIFTATTGASFYSSTHQLTVNRAEFIISSIHEELPAPDEDIILLFDWSKSSIKTPVSINLSKYISAEIDLQELKSWEIDLDKITPPLKLRHKKAGDFFYPTGMSGKKKISKFFKDEKICILAKPKIWLLSDGNDNILGVLPLRQDRRFCAQQNSAAVTKIEFNK